jgi:hypothetical protein
MTTIYKGAAMVTSSEWTYTQDEGMRHTAIARGVERNVRSYAEGLRIQGYDISLNQASSYWTAVATRTYAYADSPFTERWVLTTEILEKDIWSHPDVSAQMFDWPPSAPIDDKDPAAYRKLITDALETGENPSPNPGGASAWLLRELSRGVQAYEHEYHILSRTVTFDRTTAGSLPSPYNMGLVLSNQILSSSQLAAQQNIPSDVLFNLPADRGSSTDDDKQIQWGWRLREQSAEIDMSTTGTFQLSWTYAGWSTFIYQKYT